MSDMDRDPFERLSQIATPEPDPRKVDAVTAMSTRVFSEQLARKTPGRRRGSWLGSWMGAGGWFMPASAAALALVAVVAVVPMLGRFGPEEPAAPDTMLSRQPAPVAETDPLPTLPPQPSTSGEIRMGAAPQPQAQGLPLDMRDDVRVDTYVFDGLELVMRSAADLVGVYLIEDGRERQIDLRIKHQSETITLSDAFFFDPGDGSAPLLLVRSGFTEDVQHWDAYVETDGGYERSLDLSLEIQNAPGREEVIRRLESPDPQ